MVSLYLIYYACLELRFLDVEINPGPRHPVPEASRILCSNVRGLYKNLSDVTVASSQYNLLLCSETLISDRRHMSELLVPGLVVLYCYAGMECHGPVGWLHMCEMVMGHFTNLNLSVAVVRCWYSGCVVLDKTFIVQSVSQP